MKPCSNVVLYKKMISLMSVADLVNAAVAFTWNPLKDALYKLLFHEQVKC